MTSSHIMPADHICEYAPIKKADVLFKDESKQESLAACQQKCNLEPYCNFGQYNFTTEYCRLLSECPDGINTLNPEQIRRLPISLKNSRKWTKEHRNVVAFQKDEQYKNVCGVGTEWDDQTSTCIASNSNLPTILFHTEDFNQNQFFAVQDFCEQQPMVTCKDISEVKYIIDSNGLMQENPRPAYLKTFTCNEQHDS